MDKNTFDVALIPGMRAALQQAYAGFRNAHRDSDNVSLDQNGDFLAGVAFSRKCPICSSLDSRLLFFTRGMHIVTCASCGLTYSKEVLTKIADRNMYERSLFMDTYREIKNEKNYSQLEAAKADYIMAAAGKVSGKKGRMLDVGSSNGQMILSAKRHGWASHGIEINSKLVTDSRNVGLVAIQGSFPNDMPSDWRNFELITLLDVLEHAEQPLELLKNVDQYLSEDGLVAVQVPNINSLIVRLEGPMNSNFCHGHWSHFSPDTLDKVMEMSGFTKVFSETIISELDKILSYAPEQITKTIEDISGSCPDNIEEISTDYLHQNLMGYKLFGVYRKTSQVL